MDKKRKINGKFPLVFGAVLALGIIIISTVIYGRVYFFNGFPITRVLAGISLISLFIGFLWVLCGKKLDDGTREIHLWPALVVPLILAFFHIIIPNEDIPDWINYLFYVAWAILIVFWLFFGLKEKTTDIKQPKIIATVLLSALMVGICVYMSLPVSPYCGNTYSISTKSDDKSTKDLALRLKFSEDELTISYAEGLYNSSFGSKLFLDKDTQTYPYELDGNVLLLNGNSYLVRLSGESINSKLHVSVMFRTSTQTDLLAALLSESDSADFECTIYWPTSHWSTIYSIFHP